MLYGATEDAIYLSPAPLYHSAPLGFTMSMLRLGATVIVMEHFDPERALALIEEHRVTHSQWVPTMFVRMLKLPEAVRARYDVSSLRYAIHAAAPCPVPVKEQMIAWWGPILYEYYAGTEGNGFCVIDSKEWLAHKGSVGRPTNAKVHILDDEYRELPPGEVGTIFFESSVKYEYHNDREKTESAKSPQGWTTLGDVGMRRRRGLALPHRSQGLHDHLGRREHLSAGDGELPDRASEGRGRRGDRRAQRGLRRGGEGGGPARRHGRRRACAREGADRVLQGAHLAR